MNIVKLSPGYYPKNDVGQPISLGKIYVGEPNTDPLVEANQKNLYIRQEDGTEVLVSQPVYTNAGGVPVYDGSPVTLLVSGNYSLSVLTSEDVQAYYIATNEDLVGVSSLFKTTTETVTLTMSLLTENLKALNGKDALIYATESSTISEDLSGGYDLSGITLIILPNVKVTLDTEAQTIEFNIRIEDGGQLAIDEDVIVNGNLESKGNTSGVVAVDAVTENETLTINGGLEAGLHQIFDTSLTVSTSQKIMADWFSSLDKAVNSGALEVELSPDTTYQIDTHGNPSEGAYIHGSKSALVQMTASGRSFQVSNNNVILEGFSIDGADLGGRVNVGNSKSGIQILNLSIYSVAGSSEAGIMLGQTSNFVVSGNEVYDCEWVGIYVTESERGKIINNISRHNGPNTTDGVGDGIYVMNSNDVIITGNIVKQNDRMGITLETEGVNPCRDIIISNNILINNGQAYTNTPSQIHAETRADVIITGNIVFATNSGDSSENRGILANSGDDNIALISNNIIIGELTTTYGMRANSNDIISNNRFYNVKSGLYNLDNRVGMIIKGNHFENINQSGLDFYAVGASTAERLSIIGNTFINVGLGDTLNNYHEAAIGTHADQVLNDCIIADNIIKDTQGGSRTFYAGIYLEGNSERVKITGNTIYNMKTNGIYIDRPKECSINNNHIEACEDSGIKADNVTTDSSFSGNTIFASVGNGLVCAQPSGSVLSNNIIHDSGEVGLFCAGDTLDNIISGNQIDNSGAEGIRFYVDATSDANDNIITGNRVNNSVNAGFEFASDNYADYNIISNNNFRGNGATSDLTSARVGANSVVANNINP